MVTWAGRGALCHVALPHCKTVSATVASRRVTTPTIVPASGLLRGTALMSDIVAACPHILQAMMALPVCMSYMHLDNTRAYLANTRA
jgi:hypothetical protein